VVPGEGGEEREQQQEPHAEAAGVARVRRARWPPARPLWPPRPDLTRQVQPACANFPARPWPINRRAPRHHSARKEEMLSCCFCGSHSDERTCEASLRPPETTTGRNPPALLLPFFDAFQHQSARRVRHDSPAVCGLVNKLARLSCSTHFCERETTIRLWRAKKVCWIRKCKNKNTS